MPGDTAARVPSGHSPDRTSILACGQVVSTSCGGSHLRHDQENMRHANVELSQSASLTLLYVLPVHHWMALSLVDPVWGRPPGVLPGELQISLNV